MNTRDPLSLSFSWMYDGGGKADIEKERTLANRLLHELPSALTSMRVRRSHNERSVALFRCHKTDV